MDRKSILQELLNSQFNGSQAEFARAIKRSPAQVHQWLSGYRMLGEAGARHIEMTLNLPLGWMDGKSSAKGGVETTPLSSEADGKIHISQYNTGGSMGSGLVLRDQPGVIENLQVNKEWLEKNVKTYTSVRNLAIVTGFGDSMKPMFNSGDPLLIDIGVKAVEYEGIYFFRIGDEGYIKRLQRIPTEDGLIIRAKSENSKAYDSFDITKKMDFEVLGVILKVWCSTDY